MKSAMVMVFSMMVHIFGGDAIFDDDYILDINLGREMWWSVA